MNNKNSNNGKNSKNSKRGSKRALPAAGGVEAGATGRRSTSRKRASTAPRLVAERAALPVIVGGPWDVGAPGAQHIAVRAEYVKRLCVSVRYANLRDQ